MRWGIFGDAHGNLQGLQAVLAALAAEGVERYLNLGDLVGYGADPNACCDVVRELGAVSLLGNHDAAVSEPEHLHWFNDAARLALEWTLDELDDDHLRWLSSLPPQLDLSDLGAVHGRLPEPTSWGYVLSPDDAAETLAACDQQLLAVGHTHLAEAYRLHPRGGIARHDLSRGGVLPLAWDSRYVLNPGSCGQPRDGSWQVAGAVLDTDDRTFTVLRRSYDVTTASNQILFAGLPVWLAVRLAEGR